VTAAVVAVFEADAGRVRLDVTGLSGASQVMTVTRQSLRPHRSGTAAVPYAALTGGVRGYSAVTIAGTTTHVWDYEYDPSDGTEWWSTTYRVVTDAGVDVSCEIQPVQTVCWLKSIPNPRTNRAVAFAAASSVKRSARRGMFPIVGSPFPVAVTDQHLAREYTITLDTTSLPDADDVETLVCSGDILFWQPQAALGAPGPLYLAAGDYGMDRPSTADPTRLVSFPATEVAQPSPDVVGVSWTYGIVRDTYASYADVMAAWDDYAGLMQGPAPGEVTA